MTQTAKSEEIELLETVERWFDDPYAFVTECIGVTPTAQQAQALRAVEPGAHVSIRAGHGVGKTAFVSWVVLWFLFTRANAVVPCVGSSKDQLRDVLWAELALWVRKLPDDMQAELEIQAEKIVVGGVKTHFAVARTARKEAPEALQGFHRENLMFVLDEASGVPDEVFEVAQGALTKKNVISIMTGNPTRLSGEFYASHHKDRHLWKTFCFSSADSEIVDNDYVDRVARKYGKDSDVYRVRVEGKFPRAEADTFIHLEDVETARARRVTPRDTDPIIWGVDPARFGDDETALCKRHGNKITYIGGIRKRDTMEVAGWIANQAKKEKPHKIIVDEIGIGAGVYDRLRELKFPVVSCNVQHKPKNDQEYARVRDEIWGNTRGAIIDGLDLCDDDELTGQLSSPKYKFDSAGRVVIESKDDMKKRGVDSPDRADALCMTFYQPRKLFPNIRKAAK